MSEHSLLSPSAYGTARRSFPLRNRMFRLGFMICWALMARWTPPMARPWRIWLLNKFGARVHARANVYASARIWYPPHLVMREGATLGPGVVCYCMDRIEIGRDAVVSQRAFLCAGSHDVDDPDFPIKTAPIVIGAAAWIAAEAFVGPGVSVGLGAVLGARGVAMKSLDDWTIYAGNPARAIRTRIRS